MELRNKKTGGLTNCKTIIVITDAGWQNYNTLTQLNEEWEDYKPVEPLIKDEKIRKAVRAWAEALCLREVYCASNGYEIYGGVEVDGYAIQFAGEPFSLADKDKIYTIAELCGEEEKYDRE